MRRAGQHDRPKIRNALLILSCSTALVLVFTETSAWSGESSPTNRVELEADVNASTLNSYYAGFAFTLSPFASYYESGLKFQLAASDTRYKYAADATGTVFSKGEDTEVDFLIGYGLKFQRGYLLALIGPATIWSWQKPGNSQPSSLVIGEAAKAVASVYAKPTDQTMTFIKGSYLTSTGSYYAQAKLGVAFLSDLFIGPELALAGRMHFANPTAEYDQWKVGGFVSSIKFGPISLDVSAGFMHDRGLGDGGYVATTVRAAF